MISFYNKEVSRYQLACMGLTKESYPKIDSFISKDSINISWSGDLVEKAAKLEICQQEIRLMDIL